MPTKTLPWIGFVSLLCFMWSGISSGMGKSPTKPPSETLPLSAAVPGFTSADNGLAFSNYDKWDHSGLPAFLQLYHCTGMALFTRQVFNWGHFDPTQPQVSMDEYRAILTLLYKVPTPTIPGAIAQTVIPGYSNFFEMSQDPNIVEIIKDILGDAIGDIFRSNWNWSVFDAFGSSTNSRDLIELNIRQTVSEGRLAMIYLTDGFKTAHSVLAYAYTVMPDRVRYLVYDSNRPGNEEQMDFLFSQAQFDHVAFGMRDPWILHPYADEFTSTEAYLKGL